MTDERATPLTDAELDHYRGADGLVSCEFARRMERDRAMLRDAAQAVQAALLGIEGTEIEIRIRPALALTEAFNKLRAALAAMEEKP